MPFTPNRSYPYPTDEFLAKTPAHFEGSLTAIDADMQEIIDKVGGKADAAQVESDLSDIRSDVSALPTLTEVEAITEERVSLLGPSAQIVAETGASAPEQTSVDGVPVLWLDTRQQSAWKAIAPTIDNVGKRVVIPADEGATYLLNGSPKQAGTYPISTSGGSVSVTVRAEPRPGYTLASPVQWTGVITAGWALLGADSLTSGSWATGRTAPGGTWTVDTPENGAISASGLTVATHNKVTSGRVAPLPAPPGSKALRFRFYFDLSKRATAGSAGSIMVSPSIASPTYPNNPAGPGINFRGLTSSYAGDSYTSADITAGNLGIESWTLTKTGAAIPAFGQVAIEITGKDVEVKVGNTVVATGSLAGQVEFRHYRVSVGGGIGVIRDFAVDTA